jgi:hypothetical protein
MIPPDRQIPSMPELDSTGALSAAVARQIEVIVTTAENAASDLVDDVEAVATRRATDIIIDSEKRAERIVADATTLATDYVTASRRQVDDFAAERIRRLSELADGLIEVTETIQARHTQVEELNHRLHELITVVGSAAEAVAREAAQSHPNLPAPPKRRRNSQAAAKPPIAEKPKESRAGAKKGNRQDDEAESK